MEPRTCSDLSSLLGHWEMEEGEQELPPHPLLSWLCSLDDAAEAVLCMRELDREHMLFEPALWRALAPSPECSQPAPRWFPGSKSQYIALRRAAAGHKARCPLVMALAQFLQGDRLAAVHHEEQCMQHQATRDHIDAALATRFGPLPEVCEGDSMATAMAAFKVRETSLATEKEAMKFLFKRRRDEEKEEKQRAKQARAQSSKGSKGSKGSTVADS